jgi:C1A family cysteine protease
MSESKGWIPEKYDPNDKPYRSRLKGLIKPRVNLAEEHPEWLEEIYSQLSTGSCVANATSSAYRYLAHKLNQDPQTKSPLMDDPSRLFVYYNARLLPRLESKKVAANSGAAQKPPTLRDLGSQNRNSFKGLNLYGVCCEKTWPFNVIKVTVGDKEEDQVENLNKLPSDTAYEEAKRSHAVEYCRLDPDHPEEVESHLSTEERKAVGIVTLMQLKQCLSEGYPVVFGFWYYWDEPPWIMNKDEWELPELPISMQHAVPPRKWDKEEKKYVSLGGHTVLAIGYDESRKQVLCQNSWGSDWSEKGRFWIAYSWITDWEATDDFWMIRLIERK